MNNFATWNLENYKVWQLLSTLSLKKYKIETSDKWKSGQNQKCPKLLEMSKININGKNSGY